MWHGEILLHRNGSKFCVTSVYDEYVGNMLKSSSNPQVEFKGNVKYLLKNLQYVIKLPCWLYWENLMQYNALFCVMLGDQNHPKRVGWFRSFLTSIWCQISPAANINIFLCDRPCLCWFNVWRLFGKTHPSSSDLEQLWIFDRNHSVWRYLFKEQKKLSAGVLRKRCL